MECFSKTSFSSSPPPFLSFYFSPSSLSFSLALLFPSLYPFLDSSALIIIRLLSLISSYLSFFIVCFFSPIFSYLSLSFFIARLSSPFLCYCYFLLLFSVLVFLDVVFLWVLIWKYSSTICIFSHVALLISLSSLHL